MVPAARIARGVSDTKNIAIRVDVWIAILIIPMHFVTRGIGISQRIIPAIAVPVVALPVAGSLHDGIGAQETRQHGVIHSFKCKV